MYLVANNLYGYAMSQSLPTGNFKFLDPINFDINKINENDKYGYMLVFLLLNFPCLIYFLFLLNIGSRYNI